MELSNDINTSALLQLLTLVLIVQISRQLEAKQAIIDKHVEPAKAQESVPSEAPQVPSTPEAQEEAPVEFEAPSVDVSEDVHEALERAEAPATILVEHGVIEALEDAQDDAQEAHERTISFVEREMIRRSEAEHDRSR